MIQGYANSYDISCVIARLGNVYGTDSIPETVAGAIIRQIKEDQQVTLRNLAAIRDFIFIQDVTDGLILLMSNQEAGRCLTVNLSTGAGSTIRDLAESACRVANRPDVIHETNPDPNQKRSRLILDNRRMYEETGWKPAFRLYDGLSAIFKAE